MALRLTDSAAAATAAPAPGVPADLQILQDARAALAAGDLAAVRACPGRIAEVADPHRRYLARRALVEHALGAAQEAGSAELMLAAAHVALDVLGPDPSEPILLNGAGVALYELGALRGAEALFRAAGTLDPSLPHVERNVAEIRRRRRQGATVKLPAHIRLALGDLERRAAHVAGRAGPGAPGTISLCMIVRDEEEMLARCLAAAVPAVDEVIVVDTGSKDRTVEIAREFGARVLEHAWNDDFAEARNVGLAVATGDWILFLDADEVLVAEDAPRLRELTRRSWREAFTLTLTNYVGGDHDGVAVSSDGLRLFRNRPQHRFEGRIHEGVLASLPAGAPERVEPAGVRVEHYGYLRATREVKGKSRRNLELLERQVTETVPTHYILYNLGSEYAALGEYDKAVGHFERSWALLLEEPDPTVPGFAASLVARYVTALRVSGRLDDAEALALRGLELFDGFTDLEFERAQIARSRGDLAAAEARLRRCLELGDAPSRYAAAVGAGTFLAATSLAVVLLGRGDVDPAIALLLETLGAHPHYVAPVLPLAQAQLRRGDSPDDAVAAIAERTGALTPSIRFLLATALHECGHGPAAETQLRLLLGDEPGADAARVALAECLLAERRWADAAAAAAEVPSGSPWAPAAAASEAFALVVAGDAAAAQDAAQRAGGAQSAVLTGWARLASGDTAAEALPADALPFLATALEALLRVEEVDAFATLLPLSERIDGLSPRVRREILASLYARRGFLDSAADEWMAACEEHGPDAQALAGLAQVAAARGATDDAVLFAESALELDPSSADAGRVLEAVGAR